MFYSYLKSASVRLSLVILLTTTFFANAQTTKPIEKTLTQQSFVVEVMGKGNPILLIPGFTSDSRVWEAVATHLSQNYEVHKISIAGFGNVPPVQSPSLESTKEQLALYIKQKQLEQPAIIGHSLGGFMGFWLESSYPNIVGAVVSVDGLPFIGTLFSRDPNVSVTSLTPRAVQLKSYYQSLDAQGMESMAARGIHVQATSKEHQKTILAMTRLSDPNTSADAIYTLMTTDLRDKLSQTNSQILLLGASGGFSDQASQTFVEHQYIHQLAKAPFASIAMNTNSRHFIMYDDPIWLLEQLDKFLPQALQASL